MNVTEADRLAKRIINTWNGGPNLTEWTNTLVDLDDGTAGTAYVRCRNEQKHVPSIALFLEVYRSLSTAYNEPIDRTCPHRRCPGDGWITVEFTEGERPYRGSVPCSCPFAQRGNEKVWRSIREARERRPHKLVQQAELEPAGDF